MVVLARRDDLVDHFAELVYLDRKDSAVLALVALLLDRLAESLIQLDDAVPEQILEADDEGRLQAHAQRFLDHIDHPDAAVVGLGLHVDEALLVHREMPRAPALKTVVLLGFRGRPTGCGFAFQRGGRNGRG